MSVASIFRFLFGSPWGRAREEACLRWASVNYPGPDEGWVATTVEILIEQIGVHLDQIHPQVNFIDDLGMDDLEPVEVVMALEEEFGIDITDEDASQLSTFDDLVNYLRPLVGPRSASE